ncbi:hypothetical protein BGW80DRAFT_1332807, partial [Lactifluus volemus]
YFLTSCALFQMRRCRAGILMNKLLDIIMSGFAAEVDAAAHDIHHEGQQTCAAHKVPMEFAFLLNWSAARWRRSTYPTRMAEWSWKDQIVPILTLIAKVAVSASLTIGKSPLLCRVSVPAYQVTENEQYMKSQPIKLRVYKVICLTVKYHGHGPAAQT